GHDACLRFLRERLAPLVDKLDAQEFTFADPDRKTTLALTNVIGVVNPGARKKVMLLTHWDTRPTADQEREPAKRLLPIPGASDGASGTALLLELARVFHARKPAVAVVLLFVDGEDWGPGPDRMFLGARQFARAPGDYRPDWAILVDMIGDARLEVPREGHS